mgnify:CR=1 FL=1
MVDGLGGVYPAKNRMGLGSVDIPYRNKNINPILEKLNQQLLKLVCHTNNNLVHENEALLGVVIHNRKNLENIKQKLQI